MNVDFGSGHTWENVPVQQLKLVRHDGSDVKIPWELSRLQYAPVLAKAHVLTGDLRDAYLAAADKLSGYEQGQVMTALVKSERRK